MIQHSLCDYKKITPSSYRGLFFVVLLQSFLNEITLCHASCAIKPFISYINKNEVAVTKFFFKLRIRTFWSDLYES